MDRVDASCHYAGIVHKSGTDNRGCSDERFRTMPHHLLWLPDAGETPNNFTTSERQVIDLAYLITVSPS